MSSFSYKPETRNAARQPGQTTTTDTTAFKVREWRPYSKNTLIAFCVLELPSGLILRDITVHRKADAMWIGLPAKEYQKGTERSWLPLIEFTDRECRQAFQEAACRAIGEYLAEEEGDDDI